MHQAGEWVGGRFPAPAIITGGDTPYRPELSLWLEVGGPIVGMAMEPPGERFAPTVALLRQSIDAPMAGPPRRPRRVRVADAELAALLRKDFGPGLDVVVADTPEFDEVLASLQEHMAGAGQPAPGYLESGAASPERTAAFFRAAARFFRAAPWKHLASDADLLTVDIETLGVRGHVVSVIGQLGESVGFIVFQSRVDFERFLTESSAAQESGGVPDLPQYLSLNFEGGRDVPEAMRREARIHRWEVADKRAFPVVLAAHGLAPYDPSAGELARLEAIANAVAELVSTEPALRDAWVLGTGLSRAITVDAGGQRVEVRLSVPARKVVPAAAGGAFDVRAQKLDADGNVDEDWAREFERELLRRFAASPEGQGAADGAWMELVLQYARGQLGAPLARIGGPELREVLFDIIPRKVTCEPESAGEIVRELRAFWTWARREHGLESADECLAVLHPGLERRLQQELSNPENFGMAKSLFMGGLASGYDLKTPEGIDRFMADANAGKVALPSLRGFSQASARPAGDSRADKSRKKKRKSHRAARKRSR